MARRFHAIYGPGLDLFASLASPVVETFDPYDQLDQVMSYAMIELAQPVFLEALDELLRRLEFGLQKGALKLIDLPVALSRGQYLGLFAAGAGTVDAVYALDQDTLVRCVGSDAAKLARGAEAIGRAAR